MITPGMFIRPLIFLNLPYTPHGSMSLCVNLFWHLPGDFDFVHSIFILGINPRTMLDITIPGMLIPGTTGIPGITTIMGGLEYIGIPIRDMITIIGITIIMFGTIITLGPAVHIMSGFILPNIVGQDVILIAGSQDKTLMFTTQTGIIQVRDLAPENARIQTPFATLEKGQDRVQAVTREIKEKLLVRMDMGPSAKIVIKHEKERILSAKQIVMKQPDWKEHPTVPEPEVTDKTNLE